MEIPRHSRVGFNQSVYILEKAVEAKKHNTCKVIILADVQARCVLPKNKKNKTITFSQGTIFSYVPSK